MNTYNDYLRSEQKSEHTISSYNQNLEKFAKYLKNNFGFELFADAKKIDKPMIKEYLVSLDKQGLAASTRNQVLYAIKSYLAWLCDDMELIEVNPADKIKSVKIPYREADLCSVEDIRTIFNYIKQRNGERNRAIMSIAVICGLRCEEMVNLNLLDYYNDDGIDYIKVLGKGNKQRKVALSPMCSEFLKEYLLIRLNTTTDGQALFLSEKTGQRMGTHAVYDLMCEIRDRCGVNFHPHKLRHTAGSLMYDETKDIATVQEVLGHRSIQTTRRYIHIPTSQAINLINNNPLNKAIAKTNCE